jgi:hypothetical protein
MIALTTHHEAHVGCDHCGKRLGAARTIAQAKVQARQAGARYWSWWNGLEYAHRVYCSDECFSARPAPDSGHEP